MKRILLISAIAVAGGALFILGYFSQDLSLHFHKPRVLARVNDTEITDLDLQREMFFLKGNNSTGFSAINREDILDRLVNDALILQEGKRLQVNVPESEVNARVIASREGYTPDEVKRSLKESRLTPSLWRDLIRKQLIIEATLQQAVENQVHVSQEEIDSYYWSHLVEFYRPPRVRARQIVLETLAQAQELKAKIDKGADFRELAAKFSRGPEKDQGGDLGWVSQTELPQTFSKALFQLKPGQVSDPVTTDYGYHLFRVDEFQEGGKTPAEEAKQQIAQDLKVEKVDRAFQAWLEDLRSKAKITIYHVRGEE
jgi:peptidyl-prolyl cis-trans isomerase C